MLLLDEPLAGLDVAAAAAIRAVLRSVLARDGRAAILVTHDLLDVFTLADRVLVLEAGRIAETGPVPEVLAAPRSQFAARIAGVNLVNGTVAADGSLLADAGDRWYAAPRQRRLVAGQHAVAVFTPAAVAVYRDQPARQPPQHRRGHGGRDWMPADRRVGARRAATRRRPGPGRRDHRRRRRGVALGAGDRVWFSVKAHEVALHPAAR